MCHEHDVNPIRSITMSALPLNELKSAVVSLIALLPQAGTGVSEFMGIGFDYIHIGANLASRAKGKSNAMQPMYDMITVLVADFEYDLVDDVNQGIIILEKILDGERTTPAEKQQLKDISSKVKTYKA
jgi:hypothetical protein